METFWARGYESTSVEDLCAAMAISRSSLYHAFGSKQALLCAALERYAAQAAARVAERLARTRPVTRAVEAFLGDIAEEAVAPHGRRGCLIGNCAVELAGNDAAAAARVQACMRHVECVFEDALARGKAAGELPPDADPRALARFLTATVQGLRLVAKADPDARALRDVVRCAVRCLR